MQTLNPIAEFEEAFERAKQSESFDASRCALATANAQGRPSVRFVLLKGTMDDGFVFYTNYDSEKAHDLAENPRGALAFHWHTLGIQVRVRGPVQKTSAEDADRYFETRDRGSQLGAWASRQSHPLQSRAVLEQELERVMQRFEGRPVTRPEFWGGFVLNPESVEFWYNRPDRLHDRLLYTRNSGGEWSRTSLYP